MKLFRNIMAVMVALVMFTACSDDDNKKDEVKTIVYKGQVSSTVPAVPNFEASVSDNYMSLTWEDDKHTSATIKLGAFNVKINDRMSYAIGEIVVEGVKVDGSYGAAASLSKENFTCKTTNAGEEVTLNDCSLVGAFADKKMQMVLTYKPGGMPMPVVTTFEGTAQ